MSGCLQDEALAFAGADDPAESGREPPVHERAVGALVERVRDWEFEPGRLLVSTVEISPVRLLDWLHANPLDVRLFWRNREGDLSVAGIGRAVDWVAGHSGARTTLLERVHAVQQGSNTVFFGGFSFDGMDGRGEWAAFPSARFVLPAVELANRGSSWRISAYLLAESRQEFLRSKTRVVDLLHRLRFPSTPAAPPGPVRVVRRLDGMDFHTCRGHIDGILDSIHRGEIRKAVLARSVELRTLGVPEPFSILRRWCAANPGCFCFALEEQDDLFMGCSPERLFRRSREELLAESLAGTVARGRDAAEDARMESRLREDPKLVTEHELVTHFIRDQLAPWIAEADPLPEVGIFKLDRIQHRHLPIRSRLKPDVRDAQLIDALHPTPAVCGFPRSEAKALLDRYENRCRGWYSGAIGVVSPTHTEFAVAIRSVLFRRDRVYLHSGVGIVEGSDPESEWLELESKIESFLAALG